MGLDEFTTNSGLQQKVSDELQSHGYTTEQEEMKRGLSENMWELDVIAYSEEGNPIVCFDVKEFDKNIANSTHTQHMDRAFRVLTDFRHIEIPKALVIPHKIDAGNKDWDSMFETIGCEIVEKGDLSRFISEIE